MDNAQAERLIAVLEQIAESLDRVAGITPSMRRDLNLSHAYDQSVEILKKRQARRKAPAEVEFEPTSC